MQLVSLFGSETIGLSSDLSIFDEVMSSFERSLLLHLDLLDLIFELTIGHVGAVVEL
jgi:hypothetical protein